MSVAIRNKLSLVVAALCLAAAAPSLFAQTITDFNPKVGTAGDAITINGSGFTGGTIAVKFFNNQTASNTVTDDNTIQNVVVPSGAATGPISVTRTPGTTVQTGTFTRIGTGPYITSFSPTLGSVGDTVTINGVHFTGSPLTVKFNGVISSALADANGWVITATVPAGATSGLISVTTPNGSYTNATTFTVIGSGPYITGFSPSTGGAGTAVVISGVHFTINNSAAVTFVRFNGTNAPGYFVATDTQIQVNAPTGVRTGPITVATALGTNTTATNFFVAPVITGFSPAAGRVGTNVNISGNNFSNATAVSFGGVPVSFSIASNSLIVATVVTGALTGPVSVTAPGGSSATSSNFVVQPKLFGFSPAFGPAGTSVTVTGANFFGATTVSFNGAGVVPSGVSYSNLTAVVPAGATTGPVTVTTTNGSHTIANNFFLPPVITSFTPTNSAPGSTVTITGNNFSNASAVNFTGAAANGFSVLNNTTIQATVPVGVITGPVSVTAPAGTTNSGSLLFYGAPVITGFSPTHGLPGTNVTIFGTNLLGTKQVQFNGLTATFNSVSNGQVTATVPANAVTGPISLTAPAGTVVSAGNFTLDYNSELVLAMSGSANPVTVGSNFFYIVTITNNGPSDAPNVKLTNTLPASVILRAVTNSQGTLATNGNPIIGTLGTIFSGGSATFRFTVTPQSTGSITNLATVGSGYADSALANNAASVITFIAPLPVLAIQNYSANQVQLSWAVALSNFVLQSSTVIASNPPWSNVTTAPFISGNQKVVIETLGDAERIYRLKQ